MRLLPALSGTNRTSAKDIMLGGYLIPRGTMIWCNLNALFNSPALWDNPDQYIPVGLLLFTLTIAHGCLQITNSSMRRSLSQPLHSSQMSEDHEAPINPRECFDSDFVTL